MKKLLLGLTLLLPFFLFAQVKLSKDFNVSTGTPFQVVDAATKVYKEVGNGQTISLKVRGKLVTIQKFDSNTMKEVKRNVYEDFPEYAKYQEFLRVGDKLFYVFEAYNKKEKTFSVYAREINIKTTTFKPAKKILTTSGVVVPLNIVTSLVISSATGQMGIGTFRSSKFDVIASSDESKILVQYRNKPLYKSDAKNYDVLGFNVFDGNFTKVWSKEVKMPHTEKEMNNLAYNVMNDGTVTMLSRVNEDKSFELITIPKGGKLAYKKLAVKKGMDFSRFELKETPKGTVLAAGYYANGTEVKVDWTGSLSFDRNINGIYVFEANTAGKIVKEIDYPFSLKFIQENISKRQKKKAGKKEAKGKAGITNLVLREFDVAKDGSLLIIGEVNYTKKEMWMTSMQNVTHYGNMVATKIAADGTILWNKKLAKNQATLATAMNTGLGAKYIQGTDAHYLLFVDNRKNANLPAGQVAAPHKGGFGGYLTAYKIDDATGSVKKHLILDLTDIGGIKAYQFNVSRIFEAKEKTFLLEVYIKNKKDTMVKMQLKK